MKKALSKSITIVLAIVLVIGMVIGGVGCSREDTVSDDSTTANSSAQQKSTTNKTQVGDTELKPEAGAKLRVGETSGAQGEWIKEVCRLFTEKYGVTATYEEIPFLDIGKLQADAPAKLAPDIFFSSADQLGVLVSSGLVYPNDMSDTSDFLPVSVSGLTLDGQMYGYPVSVDMYNLIYNKDYLKEPPKTFNEVISFSKEFNDLQNKRYGFAMQLDLFYSYSFLGSYGGYIFGNNGMDINDIGLNNDGAVEGAKFMQSLKEIIPVSSIGLNWDIITGLFTSGKVAMYIGGAWEIPKIEEAGVNYGVVPLPIMPNGKHPTTIASVRGMFVNSFTDYPNASALFAQFASSKEMLEKRYTITKELPTLNSLLQDDSICTDKFSKASIEQLQYSHVLPCIPEINTIWDPMKQAMELIWDKGEDPKTCLDNAVKNIKDMLDSGNSKKEEKSPF